MNDVMTDLRPLIARVTDVDADAIAPGSRFEGLGNWGSLAAMRLLSAVEKTFAVRMDLRRYTRIETVGELADEILTRLPIGPPVGTTVGRS